MAASLYSDLLLVLHHSICLIEYLEMMAWHFPEKLHSYMASVLIAPSLVSCPGMPGAVTQGQSSNLCEVPSEEPELATPAGLDAPLPGLQQPHL